jgi:hypothetical protein
MEGMVMKTETDCMIKYRVTQSAYLGAITDQRNDEFDPWVQRLRGMMQVFEEVLEIEPKTFG